jgi:nucleoside-diphosphate-sugar epimerase
MRVLVTGAAGLIGRKVTQALEAEHDLRLGDLRPLDDPRWVPLSITNQDQVRDALHGMDAIVHLAIASGHEGDFEDPAFNQLRFDVNVKGTWILASMAAEAGIRRFVHTSSLMVVWGYPSPTSVAGDAPARPVGTYALTKYLAEKVCEQLARERGLSVVCLRIPKPVDLEEPGWKQRRLRPQWIAFPDLVHAYQLALSTPAVSFEIVTVVGESSRRRWDLSRAETVLGWRPRLRLEEMGYTLGAEDEPFQPLR